MDLRCGVVFISRGGRGRCRWLAADVKLIALNNNPLNDVAHRGRAPS
jgi:hypothetical protein